MFLHCVMFKWKPEVDSAHIDRVRAGLDQLGRLDAIRSYQHGPDAGVSEGNYDYAVVAGFDSVSDWEVYRDDSGHQQLIAELLRPYIDERSAVQFEIPG